MVARSSQRSSLRSKNHIKINVGNTVLFNNGEIKDTVARRSRNQRDLGVQRLGNPYFSRLLNPIEISFQPED